MTASTLPQQFHFNLPPWVQESVSGIASPIPLLEDRMNLALDLVEKNMSHRGGPFAALVFNANNHHLLAAGVNLVLQEHWPAGHAEVVALSLAYKALEKMNTTVPLELVTSCEPCMMCMGASLWAGIRRIVIGAAGQDAESIGFDEGPKPSDWKKQFEQRNIQVIEGVCLARAQSLFTLYQQNSGRIYNAGQLR